MLLEGLLIAAIASGIPAEGLGPDFIRTPAAVESTSQDTARLVSEFGKIKKSEVAQRLDAFFTEIGKMPGSIGCVMSYGEQKDVDNYQTMFIDHVKEKGYDVGRITFVGAGKRKEAKFQLWLVPEGAAFPEIDPTAP